MDNFVPRKLNYKNGFGEILQQTRLSKGLKIETIANNIGIKAEYLVALEEEDFNSLPAGLYGSNYLKKYSQYLQLNFKELLLIWKNSTNSSAVNNPFSKKVVEKNKLIVFPKIVKNILISIAVLICFLYLIFYFQKIVFSPKLIVTEPSKNLSINENRITIKGNTTKEAEITINGETVLNTHDGYFIQTINLKKGLNKIIIKAKKKYSRERIVIRQILVK